MLPALQGGDFCRHVYREFNRQADARASLAIQTQQTTDEEYDFPQCCRGVKVLRAILCFDGGRKREQAGAGWTLSFDPGGGLPLHLWRARSFPLGRATSCTAELAALADACQFIKRMAGCPEAADLQSLLLSEEETCAVRRLVLDLAPLI